MTEQARIRAKKGISSQGENVQWSTEVKHGGRVRRGLHWF